MNTKGGHIFKFATKLKNCVSTIKAANNIGYLHSSELAREITSKMSPSMVHLYNRFIHQENNYKKMPSLILLSKFLFLEAEMACRDGTSDIFIKPVQQSVIKSKLGTYRGRQANPYNSNKTDQRKRHYTFSTVGDSQDQDTEEKRQEASENDAVVNSCNYCSSIEHRTNKCEGLAQISPDKQL